MRVLLFLGPPGAGKSSLIGALLKNECLSGRVAFVFNDAGTSQTVDTAILAGLADFHPLMRGCFGCRDVGEFRRTMQALQAQDYAWLLIEPMGFVDGHEIPSALRDMDVAFEVMTLVDVAHFEQNTRLLSQVQSSQMAAATLAIGLTKVPSEMTKLDDVQLELVMESIGKQAPGVKVGFISLGMVPDWLLERLQARPRRRLMQASSDHSDHDHAGSHHHDHHSHEVHGIYPYSYMLAKHATLADLRALAEQLGVIRMKGVFHGSQFHVVHGTWSDGVEDSSPAFVTLYSLQPIDEVMLAAFIEPDLSERKDVQALLQSTQGLSEQDVCSAVEEALARLPAGVVMTPDGPDTNPEMHELLNELRKREGVPPELNARAIRARVEYYLSVVDVVYPGSIWWSGKAAAKRKRDLAIGIGWFARHKPQELGEALMMRCRNAPLSRLLALGLIGLERHNEDDGRALTMASEAWDTVAFIGDMDERLERGFRHAHALALKENRPELAAAWLRDLPPL